MKCVKFNCKSHVVSTMKEIQQKIVNKINKTNMLGQYGKKTQFINTISANFEYNSLV